MQLRRAAGPALAALLAFAPSASAAAGPQAPPGAGTTAAADALPAAGVAEVVICASHHHVLRHWLRAVDEGWLPAEGVTVVHFDAHPDLALPAGPVPRALRARPGALEAGLDIASFQLAAVWLGLVGRVVWLRPAWARQLPDGQHRFRLGLGPDGLLHVDHPADYWVLETGWAPRDTLREPVEVRLRVARLDAVAAADAQAPLAAAPAILDIDLDGFATRNPAAERLRAAGVSDPVLDELRRIFDPERLALVPDPEARRAQVEAILGGVRAVTGGGAWDGLWGAWTLWQAGLGAGDLWRLWQLADALPPDAVAALVEDGRELVGLPERRVATRAEIADTAGRLAALLAHGAVHPRLVTVSRSVEDGFTPPELWPEIEWTLLLALRPQLAPGTKIRFDRTRPAPRPATPLAPATPPGR